MKSLLLLKTRSNHMERHRVLLHVADLHHLVVIHLDGSSKFIHRMQSALLLKTLNEHLHTAAALRLLVRHKLESANRSSRAPCGGAWARNIFGPAAVRAVLYDQDSVRVLPKLIWAPHHHLHYLPVPRGQPPDVIFNWEAVAVTAHVRQCDPSLPSNWRPDPPQEVRALMQNLLHNALSLIVLLPHIVVALQYLHPRPRIEVLTPTGRCLLQPSSLVEPLSLPDADCHFPAAAPILLSTRWFLIGSGLTLS